MRHTLIDLEYSGELYSGQKDDDAVGDDGNIMRNGIFMFLLD